MQLASGLLFCRSIRHTRGSQSIEHPHSINMRLDHRDQNRGPHFMVLESQGPLSSHFVNAVTSYFVANTLLSVSDVLKKCVLRVLAQSLRASLFYVKHCPCSPEDLTSWPSWWVKLPKGKTETLKRGQTDDNAFRLPYAIRRRSSNSPDLFTSHPKFEC